MIKITIDESRHFALLQPQGPLSPDDFTSISRVIDPYLEEKGPLHALVIHAPQFPGWDSFAGLVSHIRFVHDHHQKLARVALVTDSAIGSLAEKLANHFLQAEIKHFTSSQFGEAEDWAAEFSRQM
ncbi:MAG: STAS/SEC14 domain-containing protein [Gammaproteobacteria bacterium]|nr:MAG: STAS/SEC14 domain-containing protein [Gammaproteobacteria bacterium]